MEIASDDSRARIHQIQEEGQTWIGLDLASNTVTFTCTAPTGQAPTCRDGDPDGEGARAAERISRVLGNDFVTNVFAPMAAQTSGVFVGNDNQAGVPVSCVASDQGGRLCVSRSGFITQISAAGVTALAQSVSTDGHDGRSGPAFAAVTARATTVVISRFASSSIAASYVARARSFTGVAMPRRSAMSANSRWSFSCRRTAKPSSNRSASRRGSR